MSKNDDTKKLEDEIYTLNYQIEQLNARLMVLSNRERDIARYTEYLAKNLDFLIHYAEHLAEVYSKNIATQNFGQTGFAIPRQAPNFDEYKEMRGYE